MEILISFWIFHVKNRLQDANVLFKNVWSNKWNIFFLPCRKGGKLGAEALHIIEAVELPHMNILIEDANFTRPVSLEFSVFIATSNLSCYGAACFECFRDGAGFESVCPKLMNHLGFLRIFSNNIYVLYSNIKETWRSFPLHVLYSLPSVCF